MVFKNIIWQLSEKIVRLSLTIVVSALMARYLGPDGFGQYNYINAIISIALVVTSLGFNRILVRESTFCKTAAENLSLVSTAFYLRLVAAIILYVLLAAFFYYTYESTGLIYAITMASIIFVSCDVIDYHLQGKSIFKVATISRIISFLVASALRMGFVFAEVSESLLYATILVEYAVAGLLIYFITKRQYSETVSISVKYFSLPKTKTLLKESWPEIIAGFGAILFMKMDQIMLQYMTGPASVGIYSAATRISEAWYFFPAAIVAAVFPVSLRNFSQNNNEEYFLKEIGFIISLLVWLSIFCAVVITAVSDYLIFILFGVQYLESSLILKLHIWAGVFLCMGIASGSWLVAQKKLKLNLYRNIAGLVLNFLLNLFLIPRYGAPGAAVATIAGLAMAFFVFDLCNKELRKMFFIKLYAFSPFQFFNAIKYIFKLK